MLDIENLTFAYKKSGKKIFNDFSTSFSPGHIYGLLGPNGAGKTTLLSILFGSIQPTAGSFKIAGHTYKDKSIKYKIGVVPQEYALYPTLTARENLHYFGSLYGLKGKTLYKATETALQRVNLLEVADKKIGHFSGGMKRRINLIAAILHQPEVLFLDEPTVGVDIVSKQIIINYLKELNSKGMSVLYTSHHLQEAQDFCQRLAILSNGSILMEDTPANLIAQTQSGRLEELFIK